MVWLDAEYDGTRRAVASNHTRLLSGVARWRSSCALRSSNTASPWSSTAAVCATPWLRGHENIHKRYLIHVAGYNLRLIMRLLTSVGTPRKFAARASAWGGTILMPDGGLTAVLLLAVEDQIAVLVVSIRGDPLG